MRGRYAAQRGASPLTTKSLLITKSPLTTASPLTIKKLAHHNKPAGHNRACQPRRHLMPCTYSTSTRNTSNPNCSYASTLGTCHSVINV